VGEMGDALDVTVRQAATIRGRWFALALSGLVLAVVALVLPAVAGAAPDRSGTVTPTALFNWDGATATGFNTQYDSAAGTPCDITPPGRCDTTLLNVDVPADFYAGQGGGMEVTLTDYSPNPTSDFDLYIYRSDAAGNRGALVGSSGGLPGAEEQTTIGEAQGFYLVQVVYFAVTQSSYKGRARLVTRTKNPPDVDDPRGLDEFLASNPGQGFKSHSEPHIAQSPIDPNVMVAGSKMYNRDRDALAEYEFKIGTYISFDAGRTWTDLGQVNTCPRDQAPPPTWPNGNRCYPEDDPNLGGTNAEDVKDPQGETGAADPEDDRGSGDYGEEYIVSDVWTDFDDEGNAYIMVLDHPPFGGDQGWGMSFHRWETPSPEDVAAGRTWSDRIPINAYGDPVTQTQFADDKNTFAVNNAGPDHDGRIGTMIACWGQNVQALVKQQTVCERSTDGGKTWPSEPIPISDLQPLVIGVHVVADPRQAETFYAVWFEYAQTIAGAPGTMRFARTTTGGQTWEPSIPITTFNPIPGSFPGQAFRNLSLPIMAVAPNGDIYITFAEYLDVPAGATDEDGKQADIRIVKSTDGGRSFGAATTVNQDKTRADQFQPYVRVAPQGDVQVAYFDRRHDPDNFFIDSYMSRSTNGGATWRDTRLSHDLSDPSINPPVSPSGEFYGDYQGLTADDCLSVWFANDTHLANSPTRDPEFDRGEPRSRFQEVHATRVPHPNPARPAACRDLLAGIGSLNAGFGAGGVTVGGRPGGRFVISGRAVKLTRSGRVRVRVSCRTPIGCSGRLKLRTAGRVRTGRGRRFVTLGARAFRYPSRRRNAIVSIPLSRSERALINRLRRTRIEASSVVTIGDTGLRGRAARTFRLHRAAR
jgi:hypothetical protein